MIFNDTQQSNLPGFFVTIEGIDGSGKSSLIRELKNIRYPFDAKHEGECVTVRQPGGSPFAESHRGDCLNEDISLNTQMLYYMALINDSMEKTVHPALNDGRLVISDRWFGSTVAYQGSEHPRLVLNTINGFNLRKPDLTIYLSLPLAMARENSRNGAEGRDIDRYDSAEAVVQERIKEVYDIMYSVSPETEHFPSIQRIWLRNQVIGVVPQNVEVIDATQPLSDVFAAAYAAIAKAIGNKQKG